MTSIYGNYKNRERKRIQQTFDKEKIFVKRCGVDINCFDAIQTANVDTNIYDVMKKYHCQEDEAAELMKQRGGEQGIYLDIVELQNSVKDIGDVKRIAQEAQTLFEQLPAEIKQKYGNDLTLFFKEQEKQQKEIQEKQQQEQQPKGEVKNETK